MKSLHPFLWCACLCALSSGLHAQYPSWWTDYGVVDGTAVDYASGPTADDYKVALQGQAKHVAEAARTYIETELGITMSMPAWYQGWLADASIDASPMVIGQLKSLAKPFYDVIIPYGVNYYLVGGGAGSVVTDYPWSTANPLDDQDDALVLLGQLKYVFSFDLTGWNPALDSDGDGLPDAWEDQFGLDKHDDGTGAGNPVNGAAGDAEASPDGLSNITEFKIGADPTKGYSETSSLEIYRP